MKKKGTKTPKKSAVYVDKIEAQRDILFKQATKKAAICVDKVETQRDTWFKQEPKKTTVCACKVGVSKSTPKSVSCAAKATPIKASLESVIANPTILKKPNNPRLPAIGTTFIKKFKGKDLLIEVKEDGLYWEGKCYKSLSGIAGGFKNTTKTTRRKFRRVVYMGYFFLLASGVPFLS